MNNRNKMHGTLGDYLESLKSKNQPISVPKVEPKKAPPLAVAELGKDVTLRENETIHLMTEHAVVKITNRGGHLTATSMISGVTGPYDAVLPIK